MATARSDSRWHRPRRRWRTLCRSERRWTSRVSVLVSKYQTLVHQAPSCLSGIPAAHAPELPCRNPQIMAMPANLFTQVPLGLANRCRDSLPQPRGGPTTVRSLYPTDPSPSPKPSIRISFPRPNTSTPLTPTPPQAPTQQNPPGSPKA